MRTWSFFGYSIFKTNVNCDIELLTFLKPQFVKQFHSFQCPHVLGLDYVPRPLFKTALVVLHFMCDK